MDIEAKLPSSAHRNAESNIYVKTHLGVNNILDGIGLKEFVCNVVESFGLQETKYTETMGRAELSFAHVVVQVNSMLERSCLKVHLALHPGLRRK
jgi:hypothetical protein